MSSILRRLSFRRRRARSPAEEEGTGRVSETSCPGAPASPVPAVTASVTATKSTSTTSLDSVGLEAASPQRCSLCADPLEVDSPGVESPAPPALLQHRHNRHGCRPRPSLTHNDSISANCTVCQLNRTSPGDEQKSPSSLRTASCRDAEDSESVSIDTVAADAPAAAGDAAGTKLNQVLASRLECPVCYQSMLPPIGQCLNGHSVCAGCKRRLARCPTCRAAFLAATNVTLNAIARAVRLPCRYRAAGCHHLLPLADKPHHEEHCPCREYPCTHCAWKGSLDGLLRHMLSEHASNIVLVSLNQYVDISYTYSRTKPVEISQSDEGVNRVSKTLLLVEPNVKSKAAVNTNNKAEKESKKDKKEKDACSWSPRALFLFHLRFDTTRVILQAALQYVGPPLLSRLFSYKVILGSENGSFKLSAWSAASSEAVDEAVLSGRVLKVDGASFRHFLDAEGRFLVRLKLVVSRLPVFAMPTECSEWS